MSKLFTDNKQMIHILSEVVVLVGLTFYFNQKNKKLMAHIEDLAQRMEEQEDLLQKHDQLLKQIVEHISKQQAMARQNVTRPPPSSMGKPIQTRKSRDKISKPKKAPVRVRFAQDTKRTILPDTAQSNVEVEVEVEVEDEVEDEVETELDLDTELREELNDLIEEEAVDSLKKE